MSSYIGTIGSVNINGENYNNQGLGGWCGACNSNTLTDDDGDNIYSATIQLEAYTYSFKFTVDGWTDQENFSPGDYGTQTAGTNVNRLISVDNDMIVSAVWDDPASLSVTSTTPATAAPIPTEQESDVVSVYSDSYTDVAVSSYNTVWSNASMEDITIDGNATKRYTNLVFNGIETTLDASGMSHFSIDIWSPDATLFKVKLVDFLGNGYLDGDTEAELVFDGTEAPAQGEWVSYNISLSDFATAGMTAFSDINQIIISSSTATVYVDNIYFYAEPTSAGATLSSIEIDGVALSGFSSIITNYTYFTSGTATSAPTITATATDSNATVSITQATTADGAATIVVTAADGVTTSTYTVDFSQEPATAAPIPTEQESDVVSVYSDSYTDVAVSSYNTVWSNASMEDITIDGNATKRYTNLVFNGIETTLDASGMSHFSIDIWSPDATLFKVKLVDFLGNGYLDGDTEAELVFDGTEAPAQGEWVSYNISLSDFATAGMTAFSDINQIIISSSTATVYVDNIYFYAEATQGLDDNVFNTVKMFPNPAKDTVQFSVNSNENLDIEIFDMLGKSVLRINDVQNEVNISDLNSGLYFVQMTLGTQQATKKLIVN